MTAGAKISEAEFARIVSGIIEDRETIIKHNPIGTAEETLLWMLLSCLISYLDISDSEAPCFTSRPDAATYRSAIEFVITPRMSEGFDAGPYLRSLDVREV